MSMMSSLQLPWKLEQACRREALEEAGVPVKVTGGPAMYRKLKIVRIHYAEGRHAGFVRDACRAMRSPENHVSLTAPPPHPYVKRRKVLVLGCARPSPSHGRQPPDPARGLSRRARGWRGFPRVCGEWIGVPGIFPGAERTCSERPAQSARHLQDDAHAEPKSVPDWVSRQTPTATDLSPPEP